MGLGLGLGSGLGLVRVGGRVRPNLLVHVAAQRVVRGDKHVEPDVKLAPVQ